MKSAFFRAGFIIFGAVSGFLAAVVILPGLLSGCAGKSLNAAPYETGVYEGSGTGLRGPIRLRVVISPYGIEDIEVLEHNDDEAVGGTAMEELREKILEYGYYTPEADAVSGATASSEGFLEALENALLKGKQ